MINSERYNIKKKGMHNNKFLNLCVDNKMRLNDGEYGALNLSQQKYKNIYLSILKAAQKYDYSQVQTIKFDYSYNRADIEMLQNTYSIDSLKDEMEFQTLLNATNWVTHILKSSNNPKGPIGNATQIIRNVIEGKNAANCYAHAVVLNEVLCALGFKCKYVFCYPIDFYPVDCHVVNLVYSVSLNKWILLDSANNVFFSDQEGNVLDIEEFRACLIFERAVEVNLLSLYDNIKHINKVLIKQKILTYMTKNMYRFGCYANSQKDDKAKDTNIDFYHLVPAGYLDKPCSFSEYDFINRVKKTEHYMLNSQLFWRVPQEIDKYE